MSYIAQAVCTGYVGSVPKLWNTHSDIPVCSFRVAAQRRYFSHKDNEWKSTETMWIQVKTFRSLANHCMNSIRVGDPVVIVGNLSMDRWDKDGVMHSSPVIEAVSVGHDLTLGTALFRKDDSHSVESGRDSSELNEDSDDNSELEMSE